MHREGWYLMAYDIACPRRLVRVHRVLKEEGLAVQKSVFLVHGTEPDMNALLNRLEKAIVRVEDDIRAYPVRSPGDLWTFGPNPLAGLPLLYLGEGQTAQGIAPGRKRFRFRIEGEVRRCRK
jgi:CRISPR-associated protein Cas2